MFNGVCQFDLTCIVLQWRASSQSARPLLKRFRLKPEESSSRSGSYQGQVICSRRRTLIHLVSKVPSRLNIRLHWVGFVDIYGMACFGELKASNKQGPKPEKEGKILDNVTSIRDFSCPRGLLRFSVSVSNYSELNFLSR